MPSSVVSYSRGVLDRWVLLREAEAVVAAFPADRRESVVALLKAGNVRFDAALGARGVPGLVLARSALAPVLEAALVAREDQLSDEKRSLGELWAAYDRLVSHGRAPTVPESLMGVREAMADGAAIEEDLLAHGERRIDDTLALASFLAANVDTRTKTEVRVLRYVRVTGLVVVTVLLLFEVVTRLTPVPNLALHAPVSASSRRLGAGPPEDLTNGKVEHTGEFATRDEPDPWVRIELSAPKRVSTVTLFNADDHVDDSLPIRVDTSQDGVSWELAGGWAAHFTPSSPAVVSFPGRMARFVRIHGRPGGALYLGEVEVR